MGHFQVRYNSRVINYDHRDFIRLAQLQGPMCDLPLFLFPTLVTLALTFLTRLNATFRELPAFDDWQPKVTKERS